MRNPNALFVFTHLAGHFVPAGMLTLEQPGAALLGSEFAYGNKYLDRSNALEIDPVSLSLQDKQQVRHQRLFPPPDTTLFGGIRDAAPDAWGRRVIEARLQVPPNSLPEARYLLEAGSNRIGALDIRSALDAAPRHGLSQITDLGYLLEAAERIEAGLPVPQQLDAIFDSGSALGGARAKATVRDADGVLWLAKFRSRGETLDVPAIEAATLDLARQCGLTVPPLRLIEVNGRSVMLIRRFDRYWANADDLASINAAAQLAEQNDLCATPKPGSIPRYLQQAPGAGRIEQRLGFVSGLTLLACDEYAARQKSYGELAQAIRQYGQPNLIRANTRELFARMVFNILVNNDDDHLRNHGFLWYPWHKTGQRSGGWALSPLYDVMPRPTLASERYLFLGVGQQGRAATLDNAHSSHAQFGLSRSEANQIIARLWHTVREWRVAFESFGLPATTIEAAASAFRHIDQLASKTLRQALP